jgi:hypothetical protein
MGLTSRFCARGIEQSRIPLQIYKDKGKQALQSPKHIDTPNSQLCHLLLGEETNNKTFDLCLSLFHTSILV